MKSPKEDYKIRKSVASKPGTREDLLIILSFYTLVIYHVFTSRSNKCTSKISFIKPKFVTFLRFINVLL